MKVLVTGGTGFVGTAVTRALHAEGHTVHLLARDVRSRKLHRLRQEMPIQASCGNVLDPSSLEKTVPGNDAVIHLVGIITEAGTQTFENVHVRGTENVVRAAHSAGIRRYIHMSALGTRRNARSRYHQTKWKAEELVRNSGLAWTIFRPSLIYGPGDGFVNLFAKIIRRSPVVPIMGAGESKFQPVAVESVARAFARALTEPAAIGQTFDLCGGEILTLNDIVEHILFVMQRRRLKLHIPMPVARMQATVLEWVFGNALGKPPPLNRDQLIMLEEGHVGEPAAANEIFNLPSTEFRQEIGRYLSPGPRPA